MTLTPALCRAARAYLGWSQDRLSRKARVGASTIADFERGARSPQDATLKAIRDTLDAAGVGFFPIKRYGRHGLAMMVDRQ